LRGRYRQRERRWGPVPAPLQFSLSPEHTRSLRLFLFLFHPPFSWLVGLWGKKGEEKMENNIKGKKEGKEKKKKVYKMETIY
jgi:hypothetical protein